MQDDRSVHLVARWRAGDQQAAAELFHRYASRLIALAQSRLSSSMAGRVDPEDVVQSVYRSFFTEARADRLDLHQSGGLWPLLVTITLNKLHNQVKRFTTQKRAVHLERSFSGEDSLVALQGLPIADDPSPVEALALVDEVDQVMRALGKLERRVLELR